jgi:hypothetical protein
MDFPTLVLIIIGVTVVVTVMAAGGLGSLFPPGAAPRPESDTAGEEDEPGDSRADSPERPAGREQRGAPSRSEDHEPDDPADNFFSDQDDFAFREPEHNRGAFSQREEDRDSLDDPDRDR